jgi:hypothetical protein
VVLVSTKGPGHFAVLEGLLRDALAALGQDSGHPFDWADRFTVRSGEGPLAGTFSKVEVHVLELDLVVPTLEPVGAYLRAVGALVADSAHGTAGWSDVITRAEAQAALLISAAGAFRDHIAVGVFVCRP